MKLFILTILGLIGFVDGLLLFGSPEWFNVFVGIEICIALPFAGAMVTMFGMTTEETKPSATLRDPT